MCMYHATIMPKSAAHKIDHKLLMHTCRSVFSLKRQGYNSDGGLFVVLLGGPGCSVEPSYMQCCKYTTALHWGSVLVVCTVPHWLIYTSPQCIREPQSADLATSEVAVALTTVHVQLVLLWYPLLVGDKQYSNRRAFQYPGYPGLFRRFRDRWNLWLMSKLTNNADHSCNNVIGSH